ncbi:MAG TPA: type VII secretion protein EccE [Rugosimonospora sp.]
MTGSPVHIRGTARVGAEAPKRSGPATLLPRRRPGHLGSVHVVQLLLAEAAVIAILVAFGRNLAVLVAALAVGLLVLVVTLGRQQGRWWLERRVMSWQFQRRRQSRPPSLPDDARLAALQWLAPGLVVDDLAAPDGSQIGVARDDAGWFAVAALSSSAPMRDDARPPLPLDTLVSALAEADQPGAVAQVVTHTVPAPAPQDSSGQSYRELLHRYGPVAVPVDRATWFAVRLDARALAELGADQPEQTTQAPTVVAALLRRLVKALRREGISAQPLDREALLDALARSCDLAPPDGSAPVRPREDWNVWYSGRLAHRSYWVRDWPSVAQATALLDWLATAPAALTSVSLILAPQRSEDVDIRCLARVAAAPEQLASVCQAVTQGARLAHAHLFELNGEQGPGAYATAPTGGGPR